jgi:hypothetical protein
MKFKNYDQFNEGIEDLFKSAHGAIDRKNLQPLEKFIGKPKFPTQEDVDAAVDFLKIDPDHLFYNKGDMLHPIIYWKGPIFYGFFGGLNMEALKMMQADKYFAQKNKFVDEMLKSKDYEQLFSRIDKKILIPSFIDMYNEIPDNKKYDVFTDLYVRSEYGFQSFPIEIIKDCFSKRKLSKDWKKRMVDLKKEMKINDDGSLTVYRGENTGSAKSDDAFSWTLSKKTAKFFADRFNSGSGKVNSKNIDPKEIIDFLPYRGESEIILFPKKFGSMNESVNSDHEVLLFRGAGMTVRFILTPEKVTAIQQHANMGRTEWFVLDKDSKFSTETTATEVWVLEKLLELFEAITKREQVEKERLGDRKETLLENPIFSKWWKNTTQKYRGHLVARDYNI